MDRYTARMTAYGNTQRERLVNRLKRDIVVKVPDNPSYKKILLNGEETYLVIDSGTQTYYKKFKSMPQQEIYAGDVVEWANSHWLVVDCDFDDEIYRDGTLNQCNWLLKWQNEVGKIIERWAVVLNASKYNAGVYGNHTITLGTDQIIVRVPVDSETLKLKKSMAKKFFIDYSTENPTTYELTGTANVIGTYDSHGVTDWIFSERAYNATEDDLKYGVCNYHSPTAPSKPDIPTEPPIDETAILNASISGKPELKLGLPRVYTVTFKDENGADVTDIDFAWNVVSDFAVEQTIDGNNIELFVDDDSLIGESFLLSVAVSDKVVAEIEITVVDMF